MTQWAGVVLAAGDGVRMKSRTPKVLHRVCGKELVRYPVDLLRQAGVESVVVVVSPRNEAAVRDVLGEEVQYAVQPSVRGTGDALERALESLDSGAGNVIVQGADAPLVTLESLGNLMRRHLEEAGQMTMLTAGGVVSQDLGRVLRDENGRVVDLVEASDWEGGKDAPAEVNGGVYCFDTRWLMDNLPRIGPSPKGERYLTSLVATGADQGANIVGVPTDDSRELLGINNRVQLAQVEAVARQRIREGWMLEGVTMTDPSSVFIDSDVTLGQDTVLRPNTMLLGCTTVGEECELGPGSVIRDSAIADRCRVELSVVEEAVIEAGVDVGPYSHLRPGAYLESGVHIGNYVEVKNSRLGAGAVSGHFSYLGDASIGREVNVGAGTVTCNFDGRDKHVTTVEEGAFIGCDTMLVAPVTVGAKSTTGAGSVVTKNVPPGRLAVGVPARILEQRKKTG